MTFQYVSSLATPICDNRGIQPGDELMPQIWLTDDELGTVLQCEPARARARALAQGWHRRRCSDGVTRAKLPVQMFEDFVLEYAARLMADRAADVAVSELKSILWTARRQEVELRRAS